ncbi:SDR family NAD(P)-dependent oxidoreductase [Serratia sp. (in: enterobacteria)]|uniref:SDR family NAD(P)-dependent oxidoreductase n=1 Tax=Serratia sp. (in: enterobacteria) TaxID=616 RepID=UPI003989AE37
MTGTKSALIVGGSTGVGLGVAEALSESGYRVHILSRSQPQASNHAFIWHQCDLLDSAKTQSTLEALCDNSLSFACFSAAYYGPKRKDFLETSWDFWREQSTIMIDGLWLTLAAALPFLLKNNGTFLGISSEVALNYGPGRASYTACKSAASGLLNSVAAEVSVQQTLITQLLPAGMVDSPGIRARRPLDFEYSSYMTTDDFKPFIRDLINDRDTELHGKTVMVSKNGSWSYIHSDHQPSSQS